MQKRSPRSIQTTFWVAGRAACKCENSQDDLIFSPRPQSHACRAPSKMFPHASSLSDIFRSPKFTLKIKYKHSCGNISSFPGHSRLSEGHFPWQLQKLHSFANLDGGLAKSFNIDCSLPFEEKSPFSMKRSCKCQNVSNKSPPCATYANLFQPLLHLLQLFFSIGSPNCPAVQRCTRGSDIVHLLAKHLSSFHPLCLQVQEHWASVIAVCVCSKAPNLCAFTIALSR